MAWRRCIDLAPNHYKYRLIFDLKNTFIEKDLLMQCCQTNVVGSTSFKALNFNSNDLGSFFRLLGSFLKMYDTILKMYDINLKMYDIILNEYDINLNAEAIYLNAEGIILNAYARNLNAEAIYLNTH